MIVLGEEITSKTRRDKLIALLRKTTELEPHFTDREIAKARRMSVATVKKLMRAGVIAPAHKKGRTSSWTAPLSAVRSFDEQTNVLKQRR